MEQWKEVIFSDESQFKQFEANPTFVRNRPSGSLAESPRYTIPTVKHSPAVMVWGYFSAHGCGGLHFLGKGEIMNSQKYLEVLKDKLPIFMDVHTCQIFRQDSAPCHTARIVKQWFAVTAVQLLDWPGNSPDLNL